MLYIIMQVKKNTYDDLQFTITKAGALEPSAAMDTFSWKTFFHVRNFKMKISGSLFKGNV